MRQEKGRGPAGARTMGVWKGARGSRCRLSARKTKNRPNQGAACVKKRSCFGRNKAVRLHG